jgi:predicted AlkP superfamily pyrophosphatase or phosphodiesterase
MNKAPLVVINVVGLTPDLLGEHSPHINALIKQGSMATLQEGIPAVTCTSQSTMLTGKEASEHGVVANGWYFPEHAEILLWRQANSIVQSDKVWDGLKEKYPGFKVSKLFWWYNMYANVDYSVTPRPIYPADGRKLPGLYSEPSDLFQKLEDALGPFPLFHFWGPKADILSSEWIANAAKLEFDWHKPNLQLVYLPHLDYNLQRLGPNHPEIKNDVAAIDRVVGDLVSHVQQQGAQVMLVSEYGIFEVDKPVNINQVLRREGYIRVRETLGWELLDCGASAAFAMADHQIAHVYINDKSKLEAIRELLQDTPGIAEVWDKQQQHDVQLNHPRSGDLVALAEARSWFTYYYWLDDAKAPDFARTVDIHRKPGYDPVELFVDPDLKFPMLRVIRRLIQKKLGMRMLMDVIPIKPELVKGSHGRVAETPEQGPMMAASFGLTQDRYKLSDVRGLIEDYFTKTGA